MLKSGQRNWVSFSQRISDKPVSKRFDGTIALGKFDEKQVAALAALGAPLLFVDFDAMAFGQNSIVVDFAGSVKTIVQEFLAQGHQKIGMLSGQEYTKRVPRGIG